MKLEIHCGQSKPLVAVGEQQCKALQFAAKYPGWHSFNVKCRSTVRAIKGLVRRGSVVVVGDQFHIAYVGVKQAAHGWSPPCWERS